MFPDKNIRGQALAGIHALDKNGCPIIRQPADGHDRIFFLIRPVNGYLTIRCITYLNDLNNITILEKVFFE
jgi:hypothetical protein